ncbi:hypothetical protein O6H91_03G101100 [Diphasiastrum complanatum]|uniref:Uncharacterized protein n=1 Tax=Diphasiastrum complanatum TaxID=34168 RepID=A0ACC2EA03_DIPCM|nr:hypothetical protein O6H91_03G101100 [Diphasiastrum complanatum]
MARPKAQRRRRLLVHYTVQPEIFPPPTDDVLDPTPPLTLQLSDLPAIAIQKIFQGLDLTSLMRARAVCAAWKNFVYSYHFRRYLSVACPPIQPWFVFLNAHVFAVIPRMADHVPVYIAAADQLCCIQLPKPRDGAIPWNVDLMTCAYGLVCVPYRTEMIDVDLCNLFTGESLCLQRPPEAWSTGVLHSVNLWMVDKNAWHYQVIIVTSVKHSSSLSGEAYRDFEVNFYDKKEGRWFKGYTTTMPAEYYFPLRNGCSAICKDILYILVQVQSRNDIENFKIYAFNLRRNVNEGTIGIPEFEGIVNIPKEWENAHIFGCNERLVLVAIIKGELTVWKLADDPEDRWGWVMITHMPSTLLFSKPSINNAFLFKFYGQGNSIYFLQNQNARLFLLELHENDTVQWRITSTTQNPKRVRHIYRGFCFEPRLDSIL